MVNDTGESPGVCGLTLTHATRLSCLSGESLRVACCPRSVAVCALGGSCATITSGPGGLGRVPRGVAMPLQDLLPGKPRELTEAESPYRGSGGQCAARAGVTAFQVLTQRSEACVTAPGASDALPRCSRAWQPVRGTEKKPQIRLAFLCFVPDTRGRAG